MKRFILSFILIFFCLFSIPISGKVEAKTKTVNKILQISGDGVILKWHEKTVTKTRSTKTTVKKWTRKKKAKQTYKEKDSWITSVICGTTYKGPYQLKTETTKTVYVTKQYTKNKKRYTIKKKVVTKEKTKYIRIYSGAYENIKAIAPKLPDWLIQEFKSRGLTFTIDASLSDYTWYPDLYKYAGFHDIECGIVVREAAEWLIYHEWGHFLANVDGDVYLSDEWNGIYNRESKKCRLGNYYYGRISVCEYFAESYSNYVLYPKKFKKQCPETYDYVSNVLARAEIKLNETE